MYGSMLISLLLNCTEDENNDIPTLNTFLEKNNTYALYDQQLYKESLQEFADKISNFYQDMQKQDISEWQQHNHINEKVKTHWTTITQLTEVHDTYYTAMGTLRLRDESTETQKQCINSFTKSYESAIKEQIGKTINVDHSANKQLNEDQQHDLIALIITYNAFNHLVRITYGVDKK